MLQAQLDSSRASNILQTLTACVLHCELAVSLAAVAAAGVLGENLIIPAFLADAVSKFWILNGSVLVFCFLVFYLIILCLKQKRLM